MIENKKNNETVGIATIGYYIPSGVMTSRYSLVGFDRKNRYGKKINCCRR